MDSMSRLAILDQNKLDNLDINVDSMSRLAILDQNKLVSNCVS